MPDSSNPVALRMSVSPGHLHSVLSEMRITGPLTHLKNHREKASLSHILIKRVH